jgi:EAL domain-containing protein (putative c-di-GMP-specific phosphodiesterase class I)/DNA-binding response OmpR family regulator
VKQGVGTASEASSPNPPPVLIVDDDDDLRTLLVLALRRARLETIEASTGEEAILILREQQVSVVVCDLRMPGMSGLDVVREIRRSPVTATLPVLLMTGSGDADSVIEGLDGGADDFLAKPVRLEELVARVRAHLRTQTKWATLLDGEIQSRADAVRAIGQLPLSADPEEIASAVVTELAERTGAHHIGVFQLSVGGRLLPLARYVATTGVVRGGPPMPPARAKELLSLAAVGPWSEHTGDALPAESQDIFWTAPPDVGAGAPIFVGGDIVGLLTLGANVGSDGHYAPVKAKLLASAIDYASVLGVVAGNAIADRRSAEEEHDRLRRLLAAGDYYPVYQPVVHLASAEPKGYEALTRFTDGVAPDIRFAEAAAAGLAVEFELAAIRAALDGAQLLPTGPFISVNVSPDVLLRSGRRLARLLELSDRPVVIEVTEHARIDDYKAFRRAVDRLPGVSLAVDDAGAGYASLSHILELEPKYAKLDISLVSAIDSDPRRQGMVAGLAFFATQTGTSLIAEGVERQEEADALRKLGVEFAQGYLFGRPGRIAI